jgi:ribosomal protein L12E/L44/L45/RPP1/RPP2
MRLIAAYLLAVLGGNPNPDAAAIKNILNAAEVSVDEEQLNILRDKAPPHRVVLAHEKCKWLL